MGVGMGIAARWMPILERGGVSPIPFFYVMGGSLVFVFLTWHIPSVAGSMMAGAVSLSLADAVYPAILGSRAAGVGLVTAGAVGSAAIGAGRWGLDHLRLHTSLHTATSEPPRAQPAGEPGSAARPPDAGRSQSTPESGRGKTSPSPGKTQGPGGSSRDPGTPPGGREGTDKNKDSLG